MNSRTLASATTHRVTWIWAVASLICIAGTGVSSILAAVILDTLMHRPEDGGSVTTVIPGFVYATATIMKVLLVFGVIAAGMALLSLAKGAASGVHASTPALPAWGLSSMALTVSTPLLGAVGVMLAQSLATEPTSLSIDGMSHISRIAVFITLALFSIGIILSITSFARRECPRLLPALCLAVNALLIGLFWHFQFYALGFDQDRWAPR